jgi:hypothetical protein
MSRAATSRLKVNAPLGVKPALRWLRLDEIGVDFAYQRSLEAGPSQSLIRRIAMFWDWSLCQPLAVAKRAGGALMIVDGQHRHAAAKLRGDIDSLPCVVTAFARYEDEAAAFVALNQQRRPLSRLDVFKAALAAGDMEASQIALALDDAGLRVASTTNLLSIPPGAVSNVRGLQSCYRAHGVQVLSAALDVLAQSYKGEVLRYAGSIFPGLEAIVADEIAVDAKFVDGERFILMTEMVRGATQNEWYRAVSAKTAELPTRRAAAASLFREAWADCLGAMMDEAA